MPGAQAVLKKAENAEYTSCIQKAKIVEYTSCIQETTKRKGAATIEKRDFMGGILQDFNGVETPQTPLTLEICEPPQTPLTLVQFIQNPG